MNRCRDREWYRNPVYPHSFPDPFVLKHRGAYWAYCTGRWHDGRCFGVLRSDDLVCWEERPGAMGPLPGEWPEYWAPEVFYDNGTFYLYYSVGNEEHMEIRVATAADPGGPFVDSGRRLTQEPFAIDAHVFQDDDGKRYLFYATDFLDRSHIGTGTVADQLLDPFTLRGTPHPVTLPRYDWHLYDPQRAEKGGVRWYTNEGPFVLRRKGRYYQMFSGGNWRYSGYGVSYALSDSLGTPEEWVHAADGTRVLPILRSVPDKVVGPGHNSVVRGPDNRQLFCVYHEWVDGERVMAIDRLEWAGERLLVLGPTFTPQPAPLMPSVTGFARNEGASNTFGWTWTEGQWQVRDGTLVPRQGGSALEARLALPVPQYLCELTVRVGEEGSAGFGLSGGPSEILFYLELRRAGGRPAATLSYRSTTQLQTHAVSLPPNLDLGAGHLLRLEGDCRHVSLSFDERPLVPCVSLGAAPAHLALTAGACGTEFAGFSLTLGWEDQFTAAVDNLADLGWSAGAGTWRIAGQQLRQSDPTASDAWIEKGVPLDSYEAVINVRLGDHRRPDGWYGIAPAANSAQDGPLLTVVPGSDGWALVARTGGNEQAWQLPPGFDPFTYQQFRFRKEGNRMTVRWENEMLGELAVPAGPGSVRLYAHHAEVAFDMVRVTALC